jgi:RNA polymerase sigma-70 factor (ECF subfamily)
MNSDSHIDSAPSTSTSLIRGVKSGDQEAWERFVRLYSGVIYSKCRKHDLSPEDSADVLQEVFKRVHEAVGDFRRDGPRMGFRRWLRTVAQNVIIDHFRGQAKHREAMDVASLLEEIHHLKFPFADKETGDDENAIDDLAGSHVEGRTVTNHGSLSATGSDRLNQALLVIRMEFEEKTWRAFWRTTADGQRSVDVAEELQMTSHSVRQAKYVVLKRLRKELAEQ